jgi:hypothetical protein
MEAVQLGFDTYYDQGGYHDTMIDYAETEASQANTEALLSDLCLIADATRCYPVEGARRGHGCDGLDVSTRCPPCCCSFLQALRAS